MEPARPPISQQIQFQLSLLRLTSAPEAPNDAAAGDIEALETLLKAASDPVGAS